LKLLLFEYCEEYNKIPTQRTTYKNKNIGMWLKKQKTKLIDKTSDMYIILSENQIIKKELDRYIQNKDNKQLSVDEWILLVFEYCTEYNKIPSTITTYKNKNIGMWLNTQKQQIMNKSNQLYNKLSENQIIKKELDRFIKNNKHLSVDGWILLVFEYCIEYNKIPTREINYKNKNIGIWLNNQKKKIIDPTSEMYIQNVNKSNNKKGIG